jgi:hypothetical protein
MRRALALALAVIVACGLRQKPAEPLENLQQEPASGRVVRFDNKVAVARPVIDLSHVLPDFHDELRWPLSSMSHPALEPRFAIAEQLAVPGVTWEELCARGVHHRVSATQRELLRYLRGWCYAAKGDVDNGCGELYPLIGSVVPGLTAAVRQDLANILVEQGGADNAEHWLSKHNMRDIQLLDLLAANYMEVGSPADAFEINRRAIDSDDYASSATKCRRLVKRIVIAHEADSTFAIQTLRLLAKGKIPDPVCERLTHKVDCWMNPANDCLRYFDHEQIDTGLLTVLDVYYEWPRGPATQTQWWTLADKARHVLAAPGAAELMVAAYEAILRIDACPKELAFAMNYAIEAVRRDPRGNAFEARLAQLTKACPLPPPPPPIA